MGIKTKYRRRCNKIMDKLIIESMTSWSKYRMTIIEKSLVNKASLNKYKPKKGKLIDKEWGHYIYVVLTIKEIKKVQTMIVNHWKGEEAPWYIDGYDINDKNEIIIAFGADDGNKGKIFQFNIKDKKANKKFIQYGLSLGIPLEQLDVVK